MSTRTTRTTQAQAALSLSASRVGDRPPHRSGREPIGLYPEMSRTKLAAITGKHITTITGILRGRTRCTLSLAMVIAQAVGLPVWVLNRDLERVQREFAEERRGRQGKGKKRRRG